LRPELFIFGFFFTFQNESDDGRGVPSSLAPSSDVTFMIGIRQQGVINAHRFRGVRMLACPYFQAFRLVAKKRPVLAASHLRLVLLHAKSSAMAIGRRGANIEYGDRGVHILVTSVCPELF
jgi:hypothetical protein